MNRRSFFKSAALAVTAIASGAALTPKAEAIPCWDPAANIGDFDFIPDPIPVRFVLRGGRFVSVDRTIRRGRVVLPNPEYINAPYELLFGIGKQQPLLAMIKKTEKWTT